MKFFTKDNILLFCGVISGLASFVLLYDRFIGSIQFINLNLNNIIVENIVIIFFILLAIFLISYWIIKYRIKSVKIKNLETQLNQIDILLERPDDSALFQEWKNTTESLLKKYFSETSTHFVSFKNNRYFWIATNKSTKKDIDDQHIQGLQRAKGIIQAALNEIKMD
jgi:hypothetical protein